MEGIETEVTKDNKLIITIDMNKVSAQAVDKLVKILEKGYQALMSKAGNRKLLP